MKKLILTALLSLMLIPALAQQKHTDYNLPEVPKRAQYIDFPSLDQGLWFAAQLTPALGFSQGASGLVFQVDLIAGYRFNEFLKLGLGLSPRFNPVNARSFPFSGLGGSAVSLPIYLDARGNIISQESRMAVPYWSFDAGYSLMDGIYFSPTVGVRVGPMRNNFIAGLTYIFQNVSSWGQSFSAIGLRLGFEF